MTKQEIEKGCQEIWELFRETDQRLDSLFKETDRKFKETDRGLNILFKETDAKIRRTEELVNRLTSKWGRFVEGLIVPSIPRLFKQWGIAITKTHQRVKAKHNGEFMEVDILGVDNDCASLLEVKSTLSVEDINEHILRLEKFKAFFPEYAGRKVYGAGGGIVIDEGADRFAYRKGLFVIRQKEENAAILNDKKFKPRVW